MSESLRAAVIGASGIGKHHAKWLAYLGCRMDAFAGTSAESVAATSQSLRDLFGFEGEGYVGLDEMFAVGPWDVISVCSPEPLHHEHFLAAIEHGAHVMCEKPLVYDPELADEELLAMGEEMVTAARDAGTVTAVNTQYAAAAPAYYELLADRGIEVGPPTSFFMQMESRGGPEGTDYEDIWVDLGSHPLSVLMGFCGPGEMVSDSARCEVSQKRVEARFDYRPAEGPVCHAEIVCWLTTRDATTSTASTAPTCRTREPRSRRRTSRTHPLSASWTRFVGWSNSRWPRSKTACATWRCSFIS